MPNTLLTSPSTFTSTFQCGPGVPLGPGGLENSSLASVYLIYRTPFGAPFREQMAYVFVQEGRALRLAELYDAVLHLNMEEYLQDPDPEHYEKALYDKIRNYLNKKPEFEKVRNSATKGIRGNLWKYIPGAYTPSRGLLKNMVLSGFLDFERSQQPFVTPPRLPTPAGVTFEFHSTVNDTAPSTIPYSSSPISYSPILQSPVTTASPESVTTPEADWDWPFLSPEGLAALVDEDLLFPPQTPTI